MIFDSSDSMYRNKCIQLQIKLQLTKISLIVPLNTVFRINVYIMWSIRSESSPFIKLTYYTFTISILGMNVIVMLSWHVINRPFTLICLRPSLERNTVWKKLKL